MSLDVPRLDGALCAEVDPELWFPEKGGNNKASRAICRHCPALDDCLDHALRWKVYGIWADTSEVERRDIRRALGIRPLILGFNVYDRTEDDDLDTLPETA